MRELKFRYVLEAYRKKPMELIMVELTLNQIECFYGITLLKMSEDYECLFRIKDRLQYTGLKDKNGKEIYEGDIVSLWAYGELCRIDVKMVEQPFDDGLTILGWNLAIQHIKDYTVIGNIYENPDLLEESQTLGDVQ